jgi:protein required for attachment to host cells
MRLRHLWLSASLAFVFLAAVTRGDELPRGDAKSQGFSPEIPALLKEAIEKKQIAGGVASGHRRTEAAFSNELADAITKLVSKYHDESATGGRAHRLVVVANPLLQKSDSAPSLLTE